MANTLKSKQGCWTCRLRRKKCDEKHPFCAICEALMITCYGYGSRPEWMDGGEREKAMANNLKQIVKKTSRHKGRLEVSLSRFQHPAIPQTDGDRSGIKIAPKPAHIYASPARANTLGHTPPSTDDGSSALSIDASTGASPGTVDGVESHLPQEALSWLSAIKSKEAMLLMHFVDTVFPLQYPMYRPNIFDGGRGWLLSMLLRTKPLYHASLALSAYHRGTVLIAASQRACSASSSIDQAQHLAVCLSEFREAITNAGNWIKDKCPSNSLGLMACVVQLIFFELFAGHGDAWRIHLRAGTDAFSKGYFDQAIELGLVESPDALFHGKTTLVIHEGRSPPEEAAIFLFVSGVVIWLDVLSSITNGKSPRLLSHHPHAIPCTSAIKLENIMGCKNWAVLQIAQIAALHELKTQALEQGCVHTVELDCRANNIRHELHTGLAEYSLSALELSSYSNPATFNVSNSEIYIITRIFILAGFIYLHLVVQGYQVETQELRSHVMEAMMMLQTKIPIHLMHVITCPLFIIGSVVKQEEERDFFRQRFSSVPILDPSLEHRSKILPILEEIWRMRASAVSWNWQDTVRLSGRTLLLF